MVTPNCNIDSHRWVWFYCWLSAAGLQELKRHLTSHSWVGSGAAGALEAAAGATDDITVPSAGAGLGEALARIGFKGLNDATAVAAGGKGDGSGGAASRAVWEDA